MILQYKKCELFWQRLWVRSDEFHPSLNINIRAVVYMNKEEEGKYFANLFIRRNIAHRLDGKGIAINFFGKYKDLRKPSFLDREFFWKKIRLS